MRSIIIFLLGKTFSILSYIWPSLGIRLSEKVFCKPQRKTFSPRQIKFIEKAKHDHFLLDGEKQHYYQWEQDGEKVLFLHGWESTSGRWFPLYSTLEKDNYSMYALDAPAHGNSEGNYFTALKYAKSIDQIVKILHPKYIVAHSVGAYATIIYLHQYESASNIEKAVLLAPTNNMMDVMNGFADVLGMNQRSLKNLIDYFEDKFNLTFDSIISSRMAKQINQQCLLIHDLQDDVLPYSGSQEIAPNLKNGTFVTTEGLGHKLISSDVYRKIGEFLRNP